MCFLFKFSEAECVKHIKLPFLLKKKKSAISWKCYWNGNLYMQILSFTLLFYLTRTHRTARFCHYLTGWQNKIFKMLPLLSPWLKTDPHWWVKLQFIRLFSKFWNSHLVWFNFSSPPPSRVTKQAEYPNPCNSLFPLFQWDYYTVLLI